MKIFTALFLCFGLFAETTFADKDGLPWEERKVSTEKVKAVENVKIEERLGKKLDLDIPLVDDEGNEVTLQKYMNGSKPVLLTLVYYTCPSLCNYHLNGITDTLKQMKWTVGKEFDIVAISFEPSDTPKIAGAKKQSYIESYGRPESANGWHFLTGTAENVKKIADQVGFKYTWDDETQQWAHPAVAYVMTPTGTISRYLYGIQFPPNTLKLSMVEAGEGKVGNVIDKFILYCFNYNPKERKYSLVAYNVVRAGAMATVLILGLFLVPFWIRYRKDAGNV